MSYRVIFGPQAAADLEDLLVYLAEEIGPVRARQYVGKIESYCLAFKTFPARGMQRDDIRTGIRLVGYRRKATIAFMIEGEIVTILRIFYGGRDVDLDEEDHME